MTNQILALNEVSVPAQVELESQRKSSDMLEDHMNRPVLSYPPPFLLAIYLSLHAQFKHSFTHYRMAPRWRPSNKCQVIIGEQILISPLLNNVVVTFHSPHNGLRVEFNELDLKMASCHCVSLWDGFSSSQFSSLPECLWIRPLTFPHLENQRACLFNF